MLERCIEEARAGRDPEAILRAHPALADEVRPLAALARELEGLPAAAASPEGLGRLLAKVDSAWPSATAECQMPDSKCQMGGEEKPSQKRTVPAGGGAAGKGPVRPRRRRMVRAAIWVGAAAAVAILAGWGLVSMSQGALPGDGLYRVKRFGEGTRYLLAFTPGRRAEMRLRFGDARLHEAYREHLDGRGLDAALLEQMDGETRRALEIAARLREARLGGVLAQAGWSFQYRCDMMEELERRATPEEKSILAPYVGSCRELSKCLPLGPWGDPPGSAREAVVRLRNLAIEGSAEP